MPKKAAHLHDQIQPQSQTSNLDETYQSILSNLPVAGFCLLAAAPCGAARNRCPTANRDPRAGQAHPGLAERLHRRGGPALQIRPLCPGLRVHQRRGRAIPDHRQQQRQPASQGHSIASTRARSFPKPTPAPPCGGRSMPLRMTSSRPSTAKASPRPRSPSRARAARGSEIYIADFDGHNAQAVTKDNNIVAAPCWVPGRMALLLRLLQAQPRRHLLSRPLHRRAPGLRPLRRLEHEPGRLARRQQSGHDPEQRRLDGPVCLRRRRQRPEAADQIAAGRVLALLVAGWQMDLFRGKEKERRALCKISASGGAAAAHHDRRHAQSHRAGLVAGRQVDRLHRAISSDFQICVVPAAGGTATMLVEGEDPSWAPNSRTLALRAPAGRATTSSLCLTCPRNNTRMFPEFREVTRNHNPVGPNSPMKDIK